MTDQWKTIELDRYVIMRCSYETMNEVFVEYRDHGVYLLVLPFRLSEEQMKLIVQMVAQMSEKYGYARDSVQLVIPKEVREKSKLVSEWLENSEDGQEYGTTWACRRCGKSIHKPFVWNPYENGYKYCPHCGTEMKVRLDD